MALRKSLLKCLQESILKNNNKFFSVAAENFYIPDNGNFTNKLVFTGKESYETIPMYKVMDQNGLIADHSNPPMADNDTILRIYKKMLFLNVADKILYESQRQGRISFYMTNSGEEAVQFGSGAALSVEDMVYSQYREVGLLLWRGHKISQIVNQNYGNIKDLGKGRQMPMHYGSKDLNFMMISSPLTTQMPQAVGAAYALKRICQDRVVITYFGEGAASEGDAHAALNFAATLECPIIFFCRNNGYAISTPIKEQYRGDGIAARGPAYGIDTLRVDGNDVFAVYNATKVAKNYVLENCKPVLIEAMTYRVGHHSTSDDSTIYRSQEEVEHWINHNNPVKKLQNYIKESGLMTDEQEEEYSKECRKEVLNALQEGEKELLHPWKEMFYDIYHEPTNNLIDQMAKMEKHLEVYGEHYPLKKHKNV